MLFIFWKIRTLFLGLFVRKTIGARALVIVDSRVLLVKHTYIAGWHTIGGGVKRHETCLQAVQRELKEEAGVICLEKPTLFGVYHKRSMGVDHYVAFYIAAKIDIQKARSFEIEETKWFNLDSLPPDITPSTLHRIQEHLGVIEKTDAW